MSRSEVRFLLRLSGFRVEKIGYDTFLPVFLGSQMRFLRPWRAKVDGPVTGIDPLKTRLA